MTSDYWFICSAWCLVNFSLTSKFQFLHCRKKDEHDIAPYSDTSDSAETQTSDTVSSVTLENHCNSEIAQYTIHIGKWSHAY